MSEAERQLQQIVAFRKWYHTAVGWQGYRELAEAAYRAGYAQAEADAAGKE